ncbi:MAG: hypothetical protein ACKOUT_15030 [Novosphingobium sp.]
MAALLLAANVLGACVPGAGSAGLERQAGEAFPRTVGPPLTIHPVKGQTVILQPGEAKPGPRVTCTLVISEAERPDQHLVTIGENDTEALTCGRLKAARAVPAPPPMQRIALLYEAYGPHTTVLQPVILYRTARGAPWRADEALAQTIGEDGALSSIPAIRRWLQSR